MIFRSSEETAIWNAPNRRGAHFTKVGASPSGDAQGRRGKGIDGTDES